MGLVYIPVQFPFHDSRIPRIPSHNFMYLSLFYILFGFIWFWEQGSNELK